MEAYQACIMLVEIQGKKMNVQAQLFALHGVNEL
jgi:hypothetical protein